MPSSASSAWYCVLAMTQTTSWPWKRTLSVARTACVSPASVGIHARPCSASRSPVTHATTPGIAMAREQSIELILAWANGDR